MDESTRSKLLNLQRMEATEAEVYRRLAKMQSSAPGPSGIVPRSHAK